MLVNAGSKSGVVLLRIGVVGSCVTRDNFNSHFTTYKDRYQVVLEQYQSSLISVMSRPVAPPPEVYAGLDGYELRCIRGDIEKSFQSNLIVASPDVVILDFFSDARFGCIGFMDTLITFNEWRIKGKPVERLLDVAMRVNPWTHQERYHDLLIDAARKFSCLLDSLEVRPLIVLNSARAVSRWVDENGQSGVFNDVDRFNSYWKLADDAFKTHVDCQVIEMPLGVLGNGSHKHGKNNVHYHQTFYDNFLKELDSLCGIKV
jgi:hypothetical protein